MDYTFRFKTEKDAFDFIEMALEIAKVYGNLTLSDLCDLIGLNSDYGDNFVGWTMSSINDKVYTTFNSVLKEYVVRFPHPDIIKNKPNKNETKVNPKSYITKKDSSTSPEPLNICVNTEEMKDSCKMLSGVLEMVKQIKDRPVFITIS